jgi:hypothetical protein
MLLANPARGPWSTSVAQVPVVSPLSGKAAHVVEVVLHLIFVLRAGYHQGLIIL